MRGLQDLQAKHPEIVVVAITGEDAKDQIAKIAKKEKLDTLRVVVAKDWQAKIGLSGAVPATVVVDGGRVRVIHDSVLDDPVLVMEADIAAIRGVGELKRPSGAEAPIP